jgi:hypothetical protein
MLKLLLPGLTPSPAAVCDVKKLPEGLSPAIGEAVLPTAPPAAGVKLPLVLL